MNIMFVELSTMFKKMVNLVQTQENQIERIDRDTEESETNVKKGRKEISDLNEDFKKKRALILKVFGVLIVFSIMYILFLQ